MLETITYTWAMLGNRLVRAASTIPDLNACLVCLMLFIVYGAIALPIGFWTGLLQREWVTSWTSIVRTAAIALIFPSLIEETLFRVLLLPHPIEQQSPGAIVLWSVGSLIAFILAHPLNALLVLPSRRETFFDGAFLTLAGLLGVVCTLTYLHSGSLWPPVALHWLIVMIWLLCLGGDRRMSSVK